MLMQSDKNRSEQESANRNFRIVVMTFGVQEH